MLILAETLFYEISADTYSVNELTGNEENPQAIGFYQHMGFETYKRSETDEQGDPYPILYMRGCNIKIEILLNHVDL